MSIFSKARIKTASSSRTKLNLSHQHVTTADFFQLNCSYIQHVVPGQSVDIDMSTFCRLAPLSVPTYADVSIHNHAFFVPFRTVMRSWDDFITDTPHVTGSSNSGGIVPFAHRVHSTTLTQAFVGNSNFVSAGTTSDYDFRVIVPEGQSDVYKYYKFNARGRQMFKLLRQLGYNLDYNLTTPHLTDATCYLSALPLLSLLRIYVDWYYPSQYVGSTTYNVLLNILRKDSPSGVTIDYQDVVNIFYVLRTVCYDSDYFVSAFDRPFASNASVGSTNFEISDISANGVNVNRSDVMQLSNGSPVLQGMTAGGSSHTSQNYNISDYILLSLHRLTDYLKRHQLAGSRQLDRYLARFGIMLDNEQLERAIHLGSFDVPINFGTVMSNADTDGASVGSYAGQGYGYSDKGHFCLEGTKDYGVIIILTSIVPRVGYVQGIDRNTLHLSKLDFFTPEFDSLGVQAISSAELYTDLRGETSTDFANRLSAIFGYTPRYAEYKCKQDKLTGDFNLPRLSTAGITSNAWHGFRLFDTSAPTTHSQDFVQPPLTSSDAVQYDRMFDLTTNEADHFPLIHRFNVTSSFPGKALFDNYDFDNAGGKDVNIEVGGTKVN